MQFKTFSIVNRPKTFYKTFQEKCNVFLFCLGDILKHFDLDPSMNVKDLKVKKNPYMVMLKVIASLLGRNASFIVERDNYNEQVKIITKTKKTGSDTFS